MTMAVIVVHLSSILAATTSISRSIMNRRDTLVCNHPARTVDDEHIVCFAALA
jgi:hypothetical protein